MPSAREKTVEITYQSFKMTKPQTVIAHPYYLKQYNNRWFLFCSTGEYTTITNYPLDRIIKVEESKVPYRETNVNFDEFFEDMIGVSKKNNQQAEIVLLRFPKSQYKYVATKPWHGSQKVLEENDDYVIIQLDVVLNFELEQQILSFGDYVEVIAPKTLRDKIRERLNKAIGQYKD